MPGLYYQVHAGNIGASFFTGQNRDRKMFLITFINIPSHKEIVMTVFPPIGILSMSSCLKKVGNKVNFIDADILRLTPSQVVEQIMQEPPQLIGISLNISQVSYAEVYIQEIRKRFPQIPIIVGGPYVTGVQEGIFNDFQYLDFAVIQEGEYAIVDFVEFLKGNRKIEDVRNLLYKSQGKTKRNKVERIKDLNSLPIPDYSLVINHIRRYEGANPSFASPSIAIMCTRGCPYECTFCSSPGNWDRKLTFRTADSIIKEILYLRETINVREVFFQDDTLNARPAWFFELCDKIIENNLHRETIFKCPFRLNKQILNKEILKKAREANFWMIFYGVENGNQGMLDCMRKHITIEEIKRAFKLTREAGIASFASFMIGNYGETKTTAHESMKLMERIMPDFGGFAITAPFPGSELYRIAMEKNLITMTDFKQYQFGDSILRTDGLTTDEIKYLALEANTRAQNLKKSWRYKWASRHSDFKAGISCGFYGKEFLNSLINRTAKKASMTLWVRPLAKQVKFKFNTDYPDIEKKSVGLTIWIGKSKHIIELNKNEQHVLSFPVEPKANHRTLLISWQVSRTWSPKKYGINEDTRELGLTIEDIWLE
jgi:radical SAM superfamily enzyme YgiQ (UPF0313 family)